MSAARLAARTGGIDAAKQVIAGSVKQKALVEVGGAAVFDGAAGLMQDMAYQDTMMKAGAQDQWNYIESALAPVGGLIGGGIVAGPTLGKGSIGITKGKIDAAKTARAKMASGLVAPRLKKSVGKLAAQLKNMKGQSDWADTVEAGFKQNPGIKELTENTAWFFDINDPDSIIRSVLDTGVPFKDDERFTEQVIDYIKGLPTKELEAINDEIEPVLGVKFGDLIERIAVGVSKGGSILREAGIAKKYANNFAHISAAQSAVDRNILAGVEDAEAMAATVRDNPRPGKYVASLWRRSLVSHPGTTMVNIQGWLQGYGARTMAEVVHGGILGTAGLATGLAGDKAVSKKMLQKSKSLFKNQVFKMRSIMDPFGSREAFSELLKMAPKHIQDKVLAETFGGVGGAPSHYGLDNKGIVKAAETYADLAARASMIKLQDVYTKTFSGIAEMDRQVRLAYDMGLDDLINSGEYWKITDEMWDATSKTLLQDTFSMNYTRPVKGAGGTEEMLASTADMVEKVSNHALLGFVFPFGRFMNNTLAFTSQYSPIGLVPIAAKMRRLGKEGVTEASMDTLGTDVAKVAVGTVGLAMLMDASMKAQEEGMQWYEHEDNTGGIINMQNTAPYSLMAVLARIGGHLQKGEAVPKEMLTQLADQAGPFAWAKELRGGPVSDVLQTIVREQNPEEAQGMWNTVAEAGASFGASIASGFTRPLDPLNRVVGYTTGTDAAIDRRQAEGIPEAIALELTRYTDNLFDTILTEPLGTTMRSVDRPEGDIHDPNPIGGLAGVKEQQPKNYTERLLGMVDMPAFMLNQRSGIPEADRFINQEVGPVLNKMAKVLLDDKTFKNASVSIKRDMVKSLLENARGYVKERLDSGYIGMEEDRLSEGRRKYVMKPQALRDEARKALGISTKDRELGAQELMMLNDYVGYLSKLYGGRTE
jgi:hypothetical protein